MAEKEGFGWAKIAPREVVHTKAGTITMGEITGNCDRAVKIAIGFLKSNGATIEGDNVKTPPGQSRQTFGFSANNWNGCSWEPQGPTPPYKNN